MKGPEGEERLTAWQRMALRKVYRNAKKRRDEPLSPEDWGAYYRLSTDSAGRAFSRVLRALPSTPRCGFCGAPFAGFGSRLVRPLGYRPSRKNPTLCASCVELAPPGGTTMTIGVMFADLRGFTTLSEERSPTEMSALLARFYACAEKVLFPDAVIDKLIGDAVMALYLPVFCREDQAQTMVEHAGRLLESVGYGSGDGPFVEVGIGADFGEAFVGNVGDRALYDFTAVGDVVNTASRLQGTAAGGEIVVSARVADALPAPAGERIEVELKGKAAPVEAYRLTWSRP